MVVPSNLKGIMDKSFIQWYVLQTIQKKKITAEDYKNTEIRIPGPHNEE